MKKGFDGWNIRKHETATYGRKITVGALAFAMIFANFPLGPFTAPIVHAVTCGFGSDIGGGQCRGYLLVADNASPWDVPDDWNDSDNSIEVIGAGGGGSDHANGGGGGGGGAYARSNNVNLDPTVNAEFTVGAGGGTETAGGDTWFCNNTTSCANYTDTNVVASADGGAGANTSTQAAGSGGTTGGVSNVPIEFAGGNGGAGNGTGDDSSGGGGGAGSPGGTGGTGGAGDNTNGGAEASGGGGGAGCDSINGANDGAIGASAGSGNGGDSCSATGGGGNTSPGGDGSNGSGGGGGATSATGGTGGDGQDWDATHGAGGGGGGGDEDAGDVGGSGGLYGAGGGGGATPGSGANGIIVITYAPLTNQVFSGTVYRMNETTAETNAKTIKIAIGTSSPGVFTTTSNGSGVWSITTTGHAANFLGMRALAWVDGDTGFRAATFTKASSTQNDIPNIDLYQNRLVVKHEGFTGTSTTNADLAFYDADNDGDIQFTSVAAGALNVAKSHELHVAPGSEFAPGGSVTLHGNASTTNPDGDLHLATGLRQDGVATTSILTMPGQTFSLAGNWFASSTSIFTQTAGSGVSFTSSSTQEKNIIATSSAFSDLSFTGSGLWTFGANPATTTGDVTMNSGNANVTAPSTRLSIGGDFNPFGATNFAHNSGTVIFYGSSAQTIDSSTTGTDDDFNHVIFRGAGTKSFGANAASTTNFTVESTSGTVTLPSTLLSVAGNYQNDATIYHNQGMLYFSTTSPATQTLSGTMTGTSAFGSTTFTGSGTKTFSNNASTTGDFIINSGATVVAPTLLTVGGNFTQNGTFTGGTGTLYFSSSTDQTISGTLTGSSALSSTTQFLGSGTKTLSNNASTTNVTTGSGTTLSAPSLLSVNGNYTNNGNFTDNSGTVLLDGTSQQTLSGEMTGTSDDFANVNILNTSGTGGGTQSIVFANSASTTGTFTMAASTSAQFLAGGMYTFPTLSINGGSASTRTWFRSSSGGSPWYLVTSGSPSVSYVNVADSNACNGSSIDATNSVDATGTSCWNFLVSLTFSGTLYAMDETTAVTTGKTIKLAIGTTTPGVFTSTSDGSGNWSVTPTFALHLGQRFLAWVDGDTTFRAATFTKASSTANNIPKIDLYQNRLVVKHEGFTGTSTTNTDLAFYDFTNDGDIQFDAVSESTLDVKKSQELHIAPGSEFAPGGTVILHGNASTTNPDGDLHLAAGLRQDSIATSSIYTAGTNDIYIAGNWFASSSSLYNFTSPDGSAAIFNSTSTQQKNVIATSSSFGWLEFAASSGSWTFGSYAATTSNLQITSGTLTAPSTNLSVNEDFYRFGTFTHNGGTTIFTGSSNQFVNVSANPMVGANAFNNIIFRGVGTKTFGSEAASTTNFTVESTSGTVTFPSTMLTIGGNYQNDSTVYHNQGMLYFSTTSPATQTLSGTMTGSSAFGSTTFIGSGTKTFSNNASSTANFIINSGATVVAPTLLTVGGNFTQNGSFTAPTGTLYFSSTTDQTISGTLNTSATDFSTTSFLGSGTKTFSNNASTTGFTIGSGVTVSAPALLSVSGDYTQNGSFTDNSGTVFFSGAGQTISGTLNTSATDFATTTFLGSGTKTLSNNASTSAGFVINSGATVVAPTLLSIGGNYTNSGTFTRNAGTVYLSGTAEQRLSGTLIGASAFHTLSILNTSGSGATQSIIFAASASTTGALTMAASTSAQFPANATSSFSSLSFNGTSVDTRVWLRSSSPGTRYGFVATTSPTTLLYTNAQDASSCGDPQGVTINASDDSNIDAGNNCGWTFPTYLTLSGTLYGMDEVTAITGLSKTIKLAIGTTTPGVFTTTSNSGDGTWSIGNISASQMALGRRILAWLSGDTTFRAATFTKASSTSNSISKIDLYQNRLAIKHEGFTGTSTTNADLAFYDADNDGDIQFTAVAGGALDVFKSSELHIAPGTEFKPSGVVTIHGNASTTNPDGDLHLATGLRQDNVATSSILSIGIFDIAVAGNWFASSTSIFSGSSGRFIFNSTSTQQKIIIATSSPFSEIGFSFVSAKPGLWTFGPYAATTTGDFSFERSTLGTLILPSTTLTVGGNWTNWGTTTHNGGTVIFNGSANQNICTTDANCSATVGLTGRSAFNHVIFRGAGAKTFGEKAASTTDFTVESTSGTVALSSTTLTIAGNYQNDSTIYHNKGHVYFGSTTAATTQTLSGTMTGASAFATTTLLSGTKTFNNNASTTANFIINSGATVVAPTLLTVGGDFTQSGTFTTGGNVYFSSSTNQAISGTLIGTSALGSTTFLGSGTKTLSSNASTTGFTVGSGVTVAAPTLLSIAGNYSNSGTFTAGTGTTTLMGTTYQSLSGTMIGTSAFSSLELRNNSATTSFQAAASTTANFYAKIPSSRFEFTAGATTTLQNLFVTGTSGNEIYLYSGTPDTRWNIHVPGARAVTYANIKDSSACSVDGNISVSDGTSIDGGNNVCWNFPTEPNLHQLHYHWRKNNGTEASASFNGDEDSPPSTSVYSGDAIRLRILISNSSGGTATNYQYRLEHASSSCSTWLPVPASGALTTEHWVMENSVNLTDGDSTTDSTGLTNPGGKDFVAGYVKDTGNQAPAHALTNAQFSEFEYSIKSTDSSESSLLYCFRLTNAGSETNITYDERPEITLEHIVRGGGSGGGSELEGSGSGPVIPGGGSGGGSGGEEGSGSGGQQGGGEGGGGGGGDLGGNPIKRFLDSLFYAFSSL